MASSPLITALERTGAHDHLCSIYDRPEERFAVATPYLRVGLERGERCLYIANDGELHIVRREMEAGGIDVERSIASGALVLSTKERAYMRQGVFDPQKMFDFWRQCAGEALNDGYAVLRATGETDWVVEGGPGLERWMEYETRLTEALRECKCLALCQYNRRLFPPELVLGVIRTHPVVIYGGMVAQNVYHVPPQDFLQEDHIEREVERQLRVIQDREGAQSALRRQQQILEAKQDELRRVQKLLAGELSAMTGLHEMSTRLTSTRDTRALLMEVLDATIALHGAQFGMIGLLDPEKQGLEIVVQRGFEQGSLERFLSGPIYAGTASGGAMRGRQRVVIEDVETEPSFAEHRAAAQAAGFRAVQATPLVSSSGDVLGVVATHFRQPHRPSERELRMTDLYARQAANMVERRRAEQRLRRSEANLAEGQRMSQTGSWSWNASTQEVYWSAEHFRIWGLEPRGTPVSMDVVFGQIHPEDLPAMQREWNDAIAQKREFQHDSRVVRPDGEVRNIHSRGKPVCDDSDTLLEYVGTVIDTTERRSAEQRLRESSQQLQLILTSITDKFFAFSKDWRYTYVNLQAAAQVRALGMDPEQLIGKVLWDVFPQVPNEADIRRVMDERVPVTDELYYPRLGEWVENNMYPSPDGGIVIFQRYVTERKRAEEALRRSEAYLSEGQRISQTGSWAWNPASGAIFWSAEHFRIFGLEPRAEAPSHKEMLERVHPEDRHAFAAKFQAAVKTKTDYVMDCRIVRPDGSLRYVQSRARPVFDASGALAEYVGTIIDTTERTQAEAKLHESERRFRELAEAIPHHVWTYRRDGSIGYHNRRLVDYTGLSEGQLARGGWDSLHPDDIERARSAWAERWSEGGAYEVEQRIRSRDGLYRRFLSRGVPVYGPDGGIVEWFGTDTPIEERKLAEEAAQKARDELAHVNRALTVAELTASIAHELNQPLAAVVTNANACERWLAGPAPNVEEAHQGLRRIARDANRASQVISRIRGLLTRRGSQRSELVIAEVIADVVSIVEGEARAKGVAMTIAVQHGLAPVLADRVQIQQVLLNLLVNAIDAMNAVVGPRTLEVRAEGRTAELVVSVKDSGVGLQAKSVERIFEPFFTTKREGMGMGLAISRSIVEAHGGKMRAASNPGAGATFEFSLPFPA